MQFSISTPCCIFHFSWLKGLQLMFLNPSLKGQENLQADSSWVIFQAAYYIFCKDTLWLVGKMCSGVLALSRCTWSQFELGLQCMGTQTSLHTHTPFCWLETASESLYLFHWGNITCSPSAYVKPSVVLPEAFSDQGNSTGSKELYVHCSPNLN